MKARATAEAGQLELGLGQAEVPRHQSPGSNSSQTKLSSWWFDRMREVVEHAPRWTPEPAREGFQPLDVSRKLVLAE
jgi:hypothetical protein